VTLPLAHAGHWLAQLLYFAPVLAVGGWIALQSLRDKRRGEDGGEEEQPGER
jgi:hypothetical protein